jgi:hydrogenase maturation protein HypF
VHEPRSSKSTTSRPGESVGARLVTRVEGSPAGVRIELSGRVQGVGFRPWVHSVAGDAGVGGRVFNAGSRVVVEAFGDADTLVDLARRLAWPPMPAAAVEDIRVTPIPGERVAAFEIAESATGDSRQPSIPPDLALCELCRREMLDPADRRYRHAFVSCTGCGPRYTISRDVPYDRARTTMDRFPMCPACRTEYRDPRDRRFHAEPIACPACGPRLSLVSASARPLPGDSIASAAAALRAGRIVAVKGLGGFHLACDATSDSAVGTLRARKRREAKPLAVMVEHLRAAERLAVVSQDEARLLESAERPIVLLARRQNAHLANDIAPGLPTLGLMLAYTPLHVLLLREVNRPLVMTSGNVSDEPMAHRDDDARARLSAVADMFLTHDRAIESRCDDSVATVIAGQPTVLRRARGYVPRAIRLGRPLARRVLACGSHLKNAVCLADGRQAWLGPHAGDLDTLEACQAFEHGVEQLERFVGITPEVVAHDLHPDYYSTRYALARPEAIKVGVQHHHAHVAAAMAEHGIDEPVIGLAWDGAGLGVDGLAWGGELLVADFTGFQRLATFRPLRLAGGDAAVRNVWRLALAMLDDAFDGNAPLQAFPLFSGAPPSTIAAMRRLIATGRHAPLAHGAGRWFDAMGAAFLGRARARYEGELAILWNHAADPTERSRYPFAFETGHLGLLDFRPLVRAATRDFVEGTSAASIAARFHNTLGAAAAEMVAHATDRAGRLPVVLTGGCFQNARLVEEVLRALGQRPVLRHGEIPPGDGGIALGQALVADAVSRNTS